MTRWGVGQLLLAGDLPLELDLPDRDRGAVPVGEAAPPSRVVCVSSSATSPASAVAFALDVTRYARVHGFTDFERDVYGRWRAVPYGAAGELPRPGRRGRTPERLPRRRLGHGAQSAAGDPAVPPRHQERRPAGYYGDDPAWKARLLALEGVRCRRWSGEAVT